MQVQPRGGVCEVGRSCLHVRSSTYDILVDCGLKQSHVSEYPDLTGLSPGQVDAVFLTHAHIDHIGGLPVLEARGVLADDAPIITTRPTDALATIMLWDSLKLHKMESQKHNRPPLYQDGDVERVLKRTKGVSYGDHTWQDWRYEFGSAGHLLGSAWVALEHQGSRILFSGDIGGRSGHLPEIADPPEADALFLESTYGDTMTHPSFRDARTKLVEAALSAAEAGKPVLIPTFGMGRAQELLQVFRERESQVPDDVSVVYDGLIEDSMNVYHAFAADQWVNESLLNYKINSGDTEPFLPDRAFKPAKVDTRRQLVAGSDSPIIIAPSGMLTGGWSPFYLWKLVENYSEARLLFVGYQAQGTPGRQILDEPSGNASVTISALMYPEEADGPLEDIVDRDPEEIEPQDNDLYGFYDKTIEVPTDWARRIEGLSGHAAANTLLQFARQSKADQIHLVHGEPHVAEHLAEHVDSNVDAGTVRVAQLMERIDIRETGAVIDIKDELQSLKAERDQLQSKLDQFDDRIRQLSDRMDSVAGLSDTDEK